MNYRYFGKVLFTFISPLSRNDALRFRYRCVAIVRTTNLSKGLINNAFSRSLSGIASGMDGAGRRRWRGVLCAVTSGQTRFACHRVSQGHSTVPCEPTPWRESSSWDQTLVSGLSSPLGSGPLEGLDQGGKRPYRYSFARNRGNFSRWFLTKHV